MRDRQVEAEIRLPGRLGIPFPVDLDGDGRHELLFLQSPGLFHTELHARIRGPGKDHFLLTAVTQSGEVRWQTGEPWQGGEPFASHGAERSLAAADLDGDGLPEVLVIRGSELLRISPLSGEILSRAGLPADNFTIVLPMRTGPGEWTVMVEVGDRGHPGYGHACPSLFLDRDLHLMRKASFPGAGHAPRALDLDGDGFDELLISYTLVDHDGRVVWSYAPCPPEEFDDLEMHVDGCGVAMDDAGRLSRVAYAGSDSVTLLDGAGRLLWRRKLMHPQLCLMGRFRDDVPAPQVFVLNKRDSLQLFDADGRELWTRMPAEHWPHGKPPCIVSRFHLFDPALAIPGPEGREQILYAEGGWPYGIDGDGERSLVLECPPATAQPDGAIYRRPDDYGYGYIASPSRDAADERLVVADRNGAWLFRLDDLTSPAQC